MTWNSIAESSVGQYDAEDFERACYRLITEQVIYSDDSEGAAIFRLISAHEPKIRDALSLFGVDFVLNHTLQYVVAKPRHPGNMTVSTDETLIALVMRLHYDKQMLAGLSTQDAEVLCDLKDFERAYRETTQRQLPSKESFTVLLRKLRRWGIARECVADSEAAPTTTVIAIRPAIVEILDEAALKRLAS